MLLTANIFQPLIDVFEAVIKFFHNTVGVPWGFSIVLLTITIRALLIPLTVKQFHSMRALQTLQPQLKEIQNKYKEDKQRQQQELMKFYKENNVNPLASCLPMVAQLPVFISLFFMLRSNLRKDICPAIQHHFAALHGIGKTTPCGPHGGASFLFINDLTNKAAGATLIVLIVLYVGTQLGSTLMMRTPTMDKNQQRMMLFLPLIFVFFIIGFPAGVLVYWITTNFWTMAQQFVIKRRLGPPAVAVAAAGGGGKGGGSSGSSGGGGTRTRKPAGPQDKSTGGRPKSDAGAAAPAPAGSGIGNALRDKLRPSQEPAVVDGPRAGAPPPPPPRKKKKRSGRRR
ncbi:MAG: YidC/Oxa1 family membrane protein insertase [Solirubrobacteraceae bacterium]